jgi:hypothetical protein
MTVGLKPVPKILPALLIDRSKTPAVIPEAPVQASIPAFTQSGTGMVRMRPHRRGCSEYRGPGLGWEPSRLCPLDRIRGQLYIVIAEPLERLADAPPFSELHKHKSNGFANPLIGMEDNLTCKIPGVADRQPLE